MGCVLLLKYISTMVISQNSYNLIYIEVGLWKINVADDVKTCKNNCFYLFLKHVTHFKRMHPTRDIRRFTEIFN